MFSWRALVLNRYSYHVLPERLPRASRPAGSNRHKPAGEHVRKNDPIASRPNITFGSKGRRIMSTFEGAAPMVPPTPDT